MFFVYPPVIFSIPFGSQHCCYSVYIGSYGLVTNTVFLHPGGEKSHFWLSVSPTSSCDCQPPILSIAWFDYRSRNSRAHSRRHLLSEDGILFCVARPPSQASLWRARAVCVMPVPAGPSRAGWPSSALCARAFSCSSLSARGSVLRVASERSGA